MRQDNESSVEEILESIKKVIARDTRAGAVIMRQKREQGGMRDDADAPEPADAEEAEEILDLNNAEMLADFEDEDMSGTGIGDDRDTASEDGRNAADRLPTGTVDDAQDDTPLTTSSARTSMRDNLAALAMLAEPGVPPQIVRTGETSLEGLTRDLLRPMLAEWLDSHLPGMVEKLVKAEIARIAGKRG